MNFDFRDVLGDQLGADAVFRIANETRPTSDYLFNSLLPERSMSSYIAEAGHMTVRATMAGAVGLDSPYPPSGLVQSSTFLERAVKLGNSAKLTEQQLIRLQEILRDLMLGPGPSAAKETLAREALNFLNKVVLQPHLDRAEWMRAQALVNGSLNWEFNELTVAVNYGLTADNILAQRTGTAAWDSTASAFWADIAALYSALRYNVRAFIVHPDTLLAIMSNSVNNLEIVSHEMFGAGGSTTTFRRLLGDLERSSRDFRETVTLISYGDEAEILDLAAPGTTTRVPFMPQKKILAIGNAGRRGYVVGEGSTPDPRDENVLGYTHVGPTVEGGGRPGRWAQLYTPEALPMQLHGRGASWVMPVIENPELIAVASSEIGGS